MTKSQHFHANKCDFKEYYYRHMINKSNIHALVLMNLLNLLQNMIKCLANLTLYLFSLLI